MTAKTPTASPKPPKKRRISPRIRKAIDLRLRKGLMWKDAAERVGISYQAIHKARQLDHVKAYEEQAKLQYIQDVEQMSEIHKARALEVARELLDQNDDKNVKARMVEFFRRESKQSAVNVQINNHVTTGKGYEFLPPDAEVIDIRASDAEPNQDARSGDSQSPAQSEDSQE